ALARTAPSVLDLEVRRMEAEARSRLADLRGMLGRSLPEGRRALQAILDGPLRFEATPERRYEIRGRLSMGGALFTTESVPRGIRTLVTAVKGRCPGPLDDGDGESGAALGRAGVEPATVGLKARCSTTELTARSGPTGPGASSNHVACRQATARSGTRAGRGAEPPIRWLPRSPLGAPRMATMSYRRVRVVTAPWRHVHAPWHAHTENFRRRDASRKQRFPGREVPVGVRRRRPIVATKHAPRGFEGVAVGSRRRWHRTCK